MVKLKYILNMSSGGQLPSFSSPCEARDVARGKGNLFLSLQKNTLRCIRFFLYAVPVRGSFGSPPTTLPVRPPAVPVTCDCLLSISNLYTNVASRLRAHADLQISTFDRTCFHGRETSAFFGLRRRRK